MLTNTDLNRFDNFTLYNLVRIKMAIILVMNNEVCFPWVQQVVEETREGADNVLVG